MHEPSVRQCRSCWFRRPMAGRLCCIRNPPTADPATGRARWPQVAPTDHCGCFCPKGQKRKSSLVKRESQDPDNVSSPPPDPQRCHCGRTAAISSPAAPAAPTIINNQSSIINSKRSRRTATATSIINHPSSIINALIHTDSFGDYCKIPLTQGRFAKVDPEDYPWLAQFRWCVKVNVDNCYAVRTVQVRGKSKRIHMHRQIMNTPQNRVCDHINHDGLDNRKDNCRNCTTAQNNAHRRKRLPRRGPRAKVPGSSRYEPRDTRYCLSGHGPRAASHRSSAPGHGPRATSHGSRTPSPPPSSRYIGVSRDKRSGKWLAYIRHRRRQRTLGLFDTELEAARARDAAAQALHGQFATLNFPEREV